MADTSPDTNRLASPSTSPTVGAPNAWASPRSSTSQTRPSPKPGAKVGHSKQQSSSYFGGDSSYEPIGESSHTYHISPPNRDIESGSGGGSRGRDALNDFETSLPLRLDYEACLAYLLLPPLGGVLLLIGEWKSDYVRYVGCFRSGLWGKWVVGWEGRGADGGTIWLKRVVDKRPIATEHTRAQ